METNNLHDYFVNLRNKQIEKKAAEQTKKVQKYLDKKKLSLVKPSRLRDTIVKHAFQPFESSSKNHK